MFRWVFFFYVGTCQKSLAGFIKSIAQLFSSKVILKVDPKKRWHDREENLSKHFAKYNTTAQWIIQYNFLTDMFLDCSGLAHWLYLYPCEHNWNVFWHWSRSEVSCFAIWIPTYLIIQMFSYTVYTSVCLTTFIVPLLIGQWRFNSSFLLE